MATLKTLKTAIFLVAILFGLNVQSMHSTPLIDAVIKGDYNQVASLLKSGASIDEQDDEGNTALMWATESSNVSPEMIKILELLLESKPDLDKQNVRGETALMEAVGANNLRAVELLLSHNPDLNKKNKRGRTALMGAYRFTQVGPDEWIKTALKIVDLLSSRMTNPDKIYIPKKSCFLSFEQNDWNGAVATDLHTCLSNKIVSIVVPQLLKVLFKKEQSVQDACKAGKLTVLASQFKIGITIVPQLVVIIPASLDELGIKAPEVEKQIENRFGFRNLTLVPPESVTSIVESSEVTNADERKKIIMNFPKIINTSLPQHPTRFYLEGHGWPGILAAIPVDQLDDFFSILSDIGTEFLYIKSCYAAANLPQIQSGLEKIVTKQIAEKKLFQRAVPEPKPSYLSGIDFAIVIQATSDVPTRKFGNIGDMFAKLDEFLQDPVWALEFGPGVEKPKITISEVISALGIRLSESLPSIRMPGKTNFFRSINIGNMEIITESRVIEAGVKRTLELLADSKSSDTTIAREAKKKLEGTLGIGLPIKYGIQFIQIFPIDLMDFAFVVHGKPLFISKLIGRGQHFIGKIIDRSYGDIKTLVRDSFFEIFEPGEGYKSDRCWFIKFVDVNKTICKKLVIHLYSTPERKQYCEYAYINEKGEYIFSKADGTIETKDKATYDSTVYRWFMFTVPSQETLKEATGGVEVTAEEKLRLEKIKGGTEALKLKEPRFARTPQDLFRMFMAD